MRIPMMIQEAAQAPLVIAQQWRHNTSVIDALCQRLKQQPPTFVMTVARGSSDHAATFAKYLFETQLQLVTASAAPSVSTLYDSQLQLSHALVIAISQSGASPDVCETIAMARKAGALTVAIVNQEQSELAQLAEYVLPMGAGEEYSVAATKTYLATLSNLIHWVARASDNRELLAAGERLPERLAQAATMDWSAAIEVLRYQDSSYVVARGFGFPVALEAALKLKETNQIHAEAFSGAEVLHGPFALVQPEFPVLMFMQGGAPRDENIRLAQKIKALDAQLMLAFCEDAAPGEALQKDTVVLPLPPCCHPICDPLLMIQAFYKMVAELAVKRGKDPDHPANLNKITKTR